MLDISQLRKYLGQTPKKRKVQEMFRQTKGHVLAWWDTPAHHLQWDYWAGAVAGEKDVASVRLHLGGGHNVSLQRLQAHSSGSPTEEWVIDLGDSSHPIWKGFPANESGRVILNDKERAWETGQFQSNFASYLDNRMRSDGLPQPTLWRIVGKAPLWVLQIVCFYLGQYSEAPVEVCWKGEVVSLS